MEQELVKYQIENCKTRLDNHSVRIDKLEQQQVKNAIQIENLYNDIRGLTGILKWVAGLIATSLIGFFIYAIQQTIF